MSTKKENAVRNLEKNSFLSRATGSRRKADKNEFPAPNNRNNFCNSSSKTI